MFEQASENTSVRTLTLLVCQKWNAVSYRTVYENSTILFTNPKAQLNFVNTYPKAAPLVQSMTFSMQYRGSPLFANATHNPKFADVPSRFPSLRRLTLHFGHLEHLEQVYIATGSIEIGLMRRPNSGSFSDHFYALSTECKKRGHRTTTVAEPLSLSPGVEAHMLDCVKQLRRLGCAVEKPRVKGLEALEDVGLVERSEDVLRSGDAVTVAGIAAKKKRRRRGKKRRGKN